MITRKTIQSGNSINVGKTNQYYGLSTDQKPIIEVPNASLFYEIDTGSLYIYDTENAEWIEQESNSGGVTPTGEIDITENGEYDVTNFAEAIVNVSGGATNFIHGYFKTNASGIQTINVPYDGNGYPICLYVTIKNGVDNPDATGWYGENVGTATGLFALCKTNIVVAPVAIPESGSNTNIYYALELHKKSATQFANAVGGFASSYDTQYNPDSSTRTNIIKFNSKNSFKLVIASSGGGLVPELDYEYYIIYSE